MAGDKRTILSSKRSRNRRKKAALRAANRVLASPTPECDSEEDAKQKHQTRSNSCNDCTSSDKGTSHSEEEEEDGLVFVCRPTMPDFCTVFMPNSEAISRKTHATNCSTFTMRIPSFQETGEGYVTYTIELATCSEPRHTFQVERRFSEFVACAAELNKLLASGASDRYFTDDEESKDSDDASSERCFQWELPAKTWFRVTQPNALEERRGQLEWCLETLLLRRDRRMCNLPVIRDFLMLDIFGVQVVEHKNLELAPRE